MYSNIVFSIKLIKVLRKIKPTLIFISSIPPETLFVASLLSKKIILDVRDIWPDAVYAYENRSLLKILFSIYCKVIYLISRSSVRKVTYVARTFKPWIDRYYKNKESIFIPLGTDRLNHLTEQQPITKLYDCAYAGGITPQFPLQEFSLLFKDSSIALMGSGPDLQKTLSCFNNVTYLGIVDKSTAQNTLCLSKYLLFPSNRYAALPNKAFDYYQCPSDIIFGPEISDDIKILFKNIETFQNNFFISRYLTRPQLDDLYLRNKSIETLADIIIKELMENDH